MKAAPEAGMATTGIPHPPSVMDATIVAEAADVLRAFANSGAALPDAFRWPIIDELGGISANLQAFAERVEVASADRFAAVANALIEAGVGADKVASLTRAVIACLATPAATESAPLDPVPVSVERAA